MFLNISAFANISIVHLGSIAYQPHNKYQNTHEISSQCKGEVDAGFSYVIVELPKVLQYHFCTDFWSGNLHENPSWRLKSPLFPPRV